MSLDKSFDVGTVNANYLCPSFFFIVSSRLFPIFSCFVSRVRKIARESIRGIALLDNTDYLFQRKCRMQIYNLKFLISSL